MTMTAAGLGKFLRGRPIATWRGDLVCFVGVAGAVVFMTLYSRMVSLGTGWYWTVFAAGLVTLCALGEIALRRWDRLKSPQVGSRCHGRGVG